jgi:hypothetical protein
MIPVDKEGVCVCGKVYDSILESVEDAYFGRCFLPWGGVRQKGVKNGGLR